MNIERSTRFFGISYHRQLVDASDERPYFEAFDRHRPATRRLLGFLGVSSAHYLVRIAASGMRVQKGIYEPGDRTPSYTKTWDLPEGKLGKEFIITHRSILPRPCFRNIVDNDSSGSAQTSSSS